MIPETAIQAAAAKLLNHTPPHWCPRCQGEDPFCPMCDRDAYELMEAALTAALPHLEAVLRQQIATDVRSVTNGPTDWDDGYYEGRHDAARIAEEGNTK